MSNRNTQCYMCKHFDRFYTKGATKYNKTKIGYCMVKKENVGIHEGCDRYTGMRKTYASKKLALVRLNNLFTEISEIRKIIEDVDRDEELQEL